MSKLLWISVLSQINSRDASGQTALHLACERGDLACVKELLEESQARTDIKDQNGETPMHYASKQDSPVIIQVRRCWVFKTWGPYWWLMTSVLFQLLKVLLQMKIDDSRTSRSCLVHQKFLVRIFQASKYKPTPNFRWVSWCTKYLENMMSYYSSPSRDKLAIDSY